MQEISEKDQLILGSKSFPLSFTKKRSIRLKEGYKSNNWTVECSWMALTGTLPIMSGPAKSLIPKRSTNSFKKHMMSGAK